MSRTFGALAGVLEAPGVSSSPLVKGGSQGFLGTLLGTASDVEMADAAVLTSHEVDRRTGDLTIRGKLANNAGHVRSDGRAQQPRGRIDRMRVRRHRRRH